MKRLFILLISMIGFINYGQKNSMAEYKFIIHVDTLNKLPDQIRAMEEKALQNAIYINPKLIFNDSVSLFYSEDVLETNNKFGVQAAKTYCNCSKPIFTDLRKQMTFKNTSRGFLSQNNEFLINTPLENNWELFNESKLINNYKCYKATMQKEVVNSNGVFKHIVTAWYCPEIPYSFGPSGYGNLPGLIFELHEKNVTFGIEKLQIKNISKIIKKPTEGKSVSLSEFNKYGLEKMKELEKNR